jgi:GNAT superfamily N-acetyltransferase
LDVNPLEPADRRVLREGVKHLSPASAYRRFFVPTHDLTDAQLTYLSTPDHQHHEALGVTDPLTGEGVAVARYIQSAHDPAIAEIAITVVDRWQGRGVGRALLNELSAVARERGIERFSGLILAENRRMIELMSSLGAVVSRRKERDTVEIVVDLRSPVPR